MKIDPRVAQSIARAMCDFGWNEETRDSVHSGKKRCNLTTVRGIPEPAKAGNPCVRIIAIRYKNLNMTQMNGSVLLSKHGSIQLSVKGRATLALNKG